MEKEIEAIAVENCLTKELAKEIYFERMQIGEFRKDFMNFEKANKYRVQYPPFSSRPEDDFGLFFIPVPTSKHKLKVLSSGWVGQEWYHVSVSLPDRCPTWAEMCIVKEMFYGDEVVLQYHPKKEDYVNNHPFCLHLWKPMNQEIPCPPSNLVGDKNRGLMI